MDQLDEVRSKIDIVQLISEYLPLKKSGRNFKSLCPFHSEKTPSFMVSPERQIFKCFGCFPVGTKIKTPEGLHLIDQIKRHDLVVSGKGEPRRVAFTHKRGYRGKMVKVFLWKLGGAVTLTEDHKVFIIDGASYTRQYKNFSKRFRRYEKLDKEKYHQKLQKYFPIKKISAGDLRVGDRLIYPIDKKVNDLKEIDLQKFITKTLSPHGTKPRKITYKIPVDKDFLKLLGFYIAEGSNNRAYIRFSLGNNEKNFAKEIARLIRKIFGLQSSIHYRKRRGRIGIEVTCCHSFLANIFENLCGKGAENKHTPFIFQHLPPKKQGIILKAILRGDGWTFKGSKSKHYHCVITTVSAVLAEQLRDIILRLGYFPTETVEEKKVDIKSVSHRQSYRIGWSTQAKSRYGLVYRGSDGAEYWMLPVRKLEKESFKGKVYNLTLEADHSYIAQNFLVANCGEGGDIFGFLMKMEGMEFGEALRTLAKRAGIKLAPYRPGPQEEEKEKLFQINHLTSEFYHYLLVSHPVGKPALNYILGRGIKKESVQLFKLGFAPAMPWGLQKFLVGKKGYKVEDLLKAGLVTSQKGRFVDFFHDRLIFPLRDHRGNIVGFSGRVVGSWKEEEAEKIGPKYINIPETPIYHKGELLFGLETTKSAIKKKNRTVVVEGELDLISSYQAGVENVVAIKGSALTEPQVKLLKRFGENISLAMDQDVAGDMAARRGIEIADSYGLLIRVVKIPESKDPDELAQKNPELLKEVVEEAIPVYDFYIQSAFQRFDEKTSEGKRKIGEELLPIFSKISDEIVKDHYIRILAERLGVSEEAILAQIAKIEEKPEFAKRLEEETKKAETRTRREVLEEYFFALSFQGEKPEILLEGKTKKLIKTPSLARIKEALEKFLKKKKKKFKSKDFAKNLPSELLEIFNGFYLQDLGKNITDEAWFEREIKKTLLELEKLEFKEELKKLSGEMRLCEKEKKPKRLKKLNEEFKKIAQKLTELEA
ncbi:DNA primase [Candidatus Shapirobacteria bacterium CG10_big_fil_rev_8_21_14_0_10_40_9]|uniref:DNA primase n=1 Tax=Candidatus Shapirobacteria bacterium CG10_big_fil_rev_8_21_14_0_10_40_9 TaxID=1974888 RepID=A0A2M8L3M1_9BACT|nr:MAG: DNA primase [Candidatus Shapirobacteria bacterium CG10_big_fil_rev_8_21_14_0_10_40_9]